MNFRFPAKNKNGKLSIENKERFCEFLHSMPEDVDVCVLKKKKANRSNNQNRYLWGHLYSVLSDHLGYTPEEIHDMCKAMFLCEFVTTNGRKGDVDIQIIRSTSSLTTVEFEEYTSKIRQWASAELGVSVLMPNEVE